MKSLTARPVDPAALRARGPEHPLLGLRWQEVPAVSQPFAVLGDLAIEADVRYAGIAELLESPPETVLIEAPAGETHAAVHATLALLREWRSHDALAATRLVLVTRGAVGERPT